MVTLMLISSVVYSQYVDGATASNQQVTPNEIK